MTTDLSQPPAWRVGQRVYVDGRQTHYIIKGFSISGHNAFVRLENTDYWTSVPLELLQPVPPARQAFDPSQDDKNFQQEVSDD